MQQRKNKKKRKQLPHLETRQSLYQGTRTIPDAEEKKATSSQRTLPVQSPDSPRGPQSQIWQKKEKGSRARPRFPSDSVREDRGKQKKVGNLRLCPSESEEGPEESVMQ